MHNKVVIIIKLLCLFLAFFLSTSFACDKTIKVGVGPAWPPYAYKSQQTYKGIDMEITRLVLKTAGFCSEFIALPSASRGLAELKKGTVDLLTAASFNQQRAKYSHFSLPYRHERMRIFGRANNIFPSRTLAQLMLSDKTFVVNSGSYYGEEFDNLRKLPQYKDQIVPVKMINQRLSMLQAKRVDYMIDDEVSGLYLIAKKGYSEISVHPYIVNDNPIHFMLSKKTVNSAQSQKIDDAIKQLETPIADIITNYMD